MNDLKASDSVKVLTELDHLARETPRYSPGRVELPFGTLRYVDPHSLRVQYEEIFIQKLYDFRSGGKYLRIVDCGGNIGLSVVRFKQLYPDSCVTVYEADPSIGEVLAENVQALGLSDVDVVSAGVWTETGEMKFVVEGGEGGRLAKDGRIAVPTIRLADMMTEPVDLLKLDIEGAEWEVLEDLFATGSMGKVRRMICEFHARRGKREALGSLLDRLANLGFAFTLPWSFCEPGLAGDPEPTPFQFASDGKFIAFLYAWQTDGI